MNRKMKNENLHEHNYIAPQCEEIHIECEKLFCSSTTQKGPAVHEGFTEENYSSIWD